MSELRAILLVDDNPDDRVLVRRVLKKAYPHSEVIEVGEPEGFESALSENAFDLVITDYRIRWTNGLEVLRRIREVDPAVGVIMYTGTGSEEIAVQGMKAGLDDYILKQPGRLDHLPEAVQAAIERSRERRKSREVHLRLERLLNNLNVGVFRSTLDGGNLDANSAFLRMLGYDDLAETTEKAIADFYVDPADRERLVARLLESGKLQNYEVQLQRKDGTRLWASVTETLAEQGDRHVIEGLIEDITERKRAEQERLMSENWLRAIIDGAPVNIIAVNRDGTFTLCEGKGLEVIGISASLVGEDYTVALPEDSPTRAHIERALAGESHSALTDVDERVFESWYAPVLDATGALDGMTAVLTEITKRVAARRSLEERENLLQAIVDAEPECVALLSQEGEIREINPAGLQMLEAPDRAALTGELFERFLVPVHKGAFRSLFDNALSGGSGSTELEVVGLSGTGRWLEFHAVPLRDPAQTILGVLGIARNITERKRAEEQLVHDALHDSLTGLPNRNLFRERLSRAVQLGRRRRGFNYAVLFLDVDRFKVVVDSLGHTLGDSLLVAIARRLEACVRPGDTVSRQGGDEFILLLEDIEGLTDATHVAENIQKALAVPFRVGGHEVFTTVSIGIALSNSNYESPEDVLRDADTAMFRAKAQGRARYQLFDSGMHVQAVSRLQLETDLRKASERNEFSLHYQPVVDLNDRSVRGFEALIRWTHPEHGLILPGKFIGVVEETGLVVPIGEWVIEEACRQARTWSDQDPDRDFQISVNLSARQFNEPDLTRRIDDVLDRTGVDPSVICLELTESALVDTNFDVSAIIRELRARGFRIYIDDFGTGYSSLSYLHRFHVDGLKIDGSFVRGLEIQENQAIVRSIVTLADSLGIDAIAEGVEDERQLEQLREFGCYLAQGFLFSKAVPNDRATVMLETGGFPAAAQS